MTKKLFYIMSVVLFLSSCATYAPQFDGPKTLELSEKKEVAHTFYLLGDAGKSELGTSTAAIEAPFPR